MPKSGSDHVIFNSKTQRMECERCGAHLVLPLPMSVTQFVGHSNVFVKAHKGCKEKAEVARG